MDIKALSVKQLNLYVKSLLEADMRLQSVAVTGELSNFKNHYSSGHLYFTLKDKDAYIRCVMFRSYASSVVFEPRDGMQVVLVGRVSIYEKDGQYQFYAESMYSVGEGDLALRFEQVKAKLEEEGLFNPENKRPLPKYPKKIAVVTSETGAAVQDIINILGRRWPICSIVLCPVSVQGESAVPEMLRALDMIYSKDIADLIIIGRGGGSAEDLQAFNNETLARKIYESPIPVISAVGHETDFSISDFVADMRAPTPSAAAELAVPDCHELLSKIVKHRVMLKTALVGNHNYNKARLEKLISSPFLKRPADVLINTRQLELDRLFDRLCVSGNNIFKEYDFRLKKSIAGLEQLSPLKVLTRGYSVVKKDGNAVTSVSQLECGDKINITLSDGGVSCTVNERE